jgi:hypothetical protein
MIRRRHKQIRDLLRKCRKVIFGSAPDISRWFSKKRKGEGGKTVEEKET